MPGPVIQGHAKLEGECTQCHSPFQKRSQNIKCLDCHKKVAADIDTGKGFHGRREGLRQMKCKRCHTEHIGRKADIIQLDEETFDHRLTDFSLEGAHRRVRCEGCHRPQKKYRDAPGTCLGCHRDDDPHLGRLGKICSKCHNQQAWKKGRFDHGKQTKFALKGKHRNVKCNGCHPNQRYKNTPLTCVSCHGLDDYHGGEFGKKCGSCHAADDWKKARFDHGKATRFPLKGRHAPLECKACHTGPLYKKKLKRDCIACHREDDDHKGGFGPKCESCHTPLKWSRVTFDHKKDTKFALRGKHSRLECRACHRGNAFEEKLGKRCFSCHRPDDVHKGQEGEKCERCHNESAWNKPVGFDHRQTRFPLLGLHARTTCEACHLTQEFKNARTDCVDCHQKDDAHGRHLGGECGLCHSPDGWKFWKFDHDTQTDFVLTGSHAGLECKACHNRPVERRIQLPQTCYGCHQSDDIHKGQEGKRCDRCHDQKTWGKNIRFDHDLTRFPLIGIHAVITCEDCHLSGEFKSIESRCVDCHEKNDYHKGGLGVDCQLCHNSNHWNLWKFDHNTQTRFVLDGAHEGLQCGACHSKPVKHDLKLFRACSACHQADDVHGGRFGQRCERCHVTRTFKEIRLRRQ